MLRRFLLASIFVAGLTSGALAQGCGSANPSCIVPTAPAGTNDNRAASTAFVYNSTATFVAPGVTILSPSTNGGLLWDNNGVLGDAHTIPQTYPGLGVSSDLVRISVGNYPQNAQYQGSGFNNNAIVGAISIPSGTFSGALIFDSGVSGYAQTNNLTRASVGVFGEGTVINTTSGSTSSAWGMNSEAINCNGHLPTCGPGYGLDFSLLEGNESDVSVFSKPGGVAPAVTVGGGAMGYQSTVYSNTPLSGGNFIAFDAVSNGLGFGGSEHVWDIGYVTGDGQATIAIEIGATARPAATLASQPIYFNWYNGSAAVGYVTLNATNTGKLTTNATLLLPQGFSVSGQQGTFTGSSASYSPMVFVDTNTGGQTWNVGPGVGTGTATSFNWYDATNTTVLAEIIDSGIVQAASGFKTGTLQGITKNCSVIPTTMTISGGIITAITGGTCS